MSSSSIHWHVKKIARRAASAVGKGLNAITSAEHSPVVRALTYHRFGDSWPYDSFCVTTKTFEAQIRWLAENQLALTHEDVLAVVRGAGTFRSGSVLVTIDDGYASVAKIAAPILKAYSVPAVVYITTGLISNGMASAGQPEPYMSWTEVERLHEAGLLIGSHSHTHRSFGKLTDTEARDELHKSGEFIFDHIGIRPSSFAYPFGTPAHYSEATGDALASLGYSTGFVSTHGCIRQGSPAIELPRVKVEGGDPLYLFQNSCRGSMDRWRYVDHMMCMLRR